MKFSLNHLKRLSLILTACLLAACAAAPTAVPATSTAAPAVSSPANTAVPTVANTVAAPIIDTIATLSLTPGACESAVKCAEPTVTAPSVSGSDEEKIIVYAPATSSGIPALLAAQENPQFEVVLYTNPSQANAIFLRGEAPILIGGLSVGLDMQKNGAPVQMVNSFVTGLSFLMTNGIQVDSFADLKGKQLYLPFQGSPLEEVSMYFASREGLEWGKDIEPVYLPFESSIEMLKKGDAQAVVLPEPNVSLVEKASPALVSLDYYAEWNRYQGSQNGYPQVSAFVLKDWGDTHKEEIAAFNQALEAAIQTLQQDPETGLKVTEGKYKLPEPVLQSALLRTRYHFLDGAELKTEVESYYQTIGKPLDETQSTIFYQPLP